MSTYDSYDTGDAPHRHRSHRERRDDREPRYVETKETYSRGPAPYAPEPPYATRTTELVRRPVREDTDLSVEEVRRDFPPPTAGYVQQRSVVQRDRYGPPTRSLSVERGARYDNYGYSPRRSYNDLDERRSRRTSKYEDEEIIKPRRRSLSRNQKIIAAVSGAALAVGGKELWDRKQGEGGPINRNPLQSAAVGAAGAFAAYEGAELYVKHAGKNEEKVKKYVSRRGRNGEIDEYYSSEEEEVKPKKSRRKSFVESALGLAGIGAAAKEVEKKHHSRRGSADSYRSTKSRSRGKSPVGAAKFQQAAKAALLAGATEAFRVRNEPGGWSGAKGQRILTAAIGAGGIDAAADRNPENKSKRHILEAVVGGLAGNRLINGSRKDIEEGDDGKSVRGTSRSRSRVRSRSRARSSSRGGDGGGGGVAGPLAALATAGLGAFAGKKILDRSRSRSRARSRRGSRDSYDSRSPSPKRERKRSKSVTDFARKGLAALGIGAGAGAAASDRGEVIEETHTVHRSRRGSDDYADSRDPYDDRYAGSHRGGGGRSARERDGQRNRRVAEGREGSDDDSSLGDSSEDERRVKKMKGKQLLTAGLATVATIHAAHNIYQSMEKREARHKAVEEGEMTPEEARKLKTKAMLQDVASVGIAALGIKGAISEIKEANSIRHECREFGEKKEERHKKRLERQQKAKGGSNGDRKAIGNGRRRGDDGYTSAPTPVRTRYADDDYGPRYADGNPYSSGGLPAPPVGYEGGYDGQ